MWKIYRKVTLGNDLLDQEVYGCKTQEEAEEKVKSFNEEGLFIKEYKTTRLIKSDVDVYQVEHADDMVWMVITNKGNASAFNISYYDYGLLSEEDGEDPNKLKYDYRKRTHAEIKPGESMYLEYHISPDTMFNIDFNLCYENEYGQYFHSPMVVRLGGKGKDLYAQCGVGAQENGKSTIEVKEWYYEV